MTAYAVRALTHYQTSPGGRRAPICNRKSVQFGPDGARSRKNVNYPRAPSSRRSGLVGPHTTSDSQLQVYDIYTTRRVLLAAHARDVNIFIWTSRKSVGHETNDCIMVHGDGTRADGRRFMCRGHFKQDHGLARLTTRAEHLWVSEQCSRRSGRLSGPSRNRSASNANLFHNSRSRAFPGPAYLYPSSAENGQVGRL